MKNGIHPNWKHDVKVTCACGNTFTTGSTLDSLHVDICSACHPFFTGEVRFVDRQGRVDKFMQRMQTAASKQAAQQAKQKAQKSDKTAEPTGPAKSYQEILRDQQSKLRQAKKATSAAA